MNNPEVVQFTEQKYKKHTRKNIGLFLKKINKDNFFRNLRYFLCKNLIGTIKIGNINNLHKTAEISYIIGNKKFWIRVLQRLWLKKYAIIFLKI